MSEMFKIRQELFVDYENEELRVEMKRMTETFSKWSLDTRDALIRRGLINLGWTPPKAERKD